MTIDNVLQVAKLYMSKEKLHKIRKAYDFAKKAHEGQKRKSGEPYIQHPLEAAYILAKMNLDENTIISSILHDVPEDTQKTLNDIKQAFGEEVAYLVNGITKIAHVHFRVGMREEQIESLKKLLIHCAKDTRVILIKLADRLHNMRTLHHIKEKEKRERIARETIEIYVPISNLFGLGELKAQLEDLCFEILYSQEYKEYKKKFFKKSVKQERLLKNSINKLKEGLDKNKINAILSGRKKSLYSIYKKVHDRDYKLSQIEDVIGIRIITEKQDDCYKALGVVHSIFKPKPRRVKDYIAVPKVNGYQSLHSTVFGFEGTITEIQIRTEQMDLEAEYGIAAHYLYKTSKKSDNPAEKWTKKILDFQKITKDDEDLLKNLKLDIFQDRIFTFTPRGDVIDLPYGATAIDFAYTIHSEIGNKAYNAEINGENTSLLTPLHTGDIIKILTKPKQNAPEIGWLNYAKTNTAKKNIKEALRKQSNKNKIKSGKELLQKEFRKSEKEFNDLSYKEFVTIFRTFKIKDIKDLFLSIGEGNILPTDVFNVLRRNAEKKSWIMRVLGQKKKKEQFVSIELESQCRPFQIAKIMDVINNLNIKIIKLNATAKQKKNSLTTKLLLENIPDETIDNLFGQIEQITGIISTKRLFPKRMLHFYIWGIITILVWSINPFFLSFLPQFGEQKSRTIFLYLGIGMLLGSIFYMRNLVRKSFPGLRENRFFWIFSFIIVTFAFFAIIAEIIATNIHFNWIAVLAIVTLVYSILISEYINYYYIE